MSQKKWNSDKIEDQCGRVVIVTGATSGLGKETARVLANKNATVIMAVRNTDKGKIVAEEIKSDYKNADIVVKKMDLASLESVKVFADEVLENYDRLDVLINNAGVMVGENIRTAEGFEKQMGTNHLGHFALTLRLLPLIRKTKNSVIQITSSVAHKFNKLNLDDINWENRKYKTNTAYGDSKVANLLFAYELIRKLKNASDAPKVTASHPGWTATELQRNAGFVEFLNNFFAQGTKMGTLPTLRAAFDKDAKSGDYFGPKGFMEMKGYPVKVKSNTFSHDPEVASKLWRISEELTGVKFQN